MQNGSWGGAEEFFAGGADLVFAVRFRVLDDFHEFGKVVDGLTGGVELEFFGFESETLFFEFELLGVVFLIAKFENPTSDGFEVFRGDSG